MQIAPSTSARTRLVAGLVSLAVLALVALASIATILPPAADQDQGASGRFVAARAFADVRTIGSAMHVTGSEAAAGVRQHIVDTLTSIGAAASGISGSSGASGRPAFTPQVREGIGDTSNLGGPAMALTRNVVAEIPGSDSTGRLILMAHYDSVQVSYGANDDGSGVATLLEVARALAAGPQLRNDVVLLLTDAEEACLCGAESFVHSDPLAANGGVVLNFESRGANGPSVMFETAAGNADLIAQYAAAVPYPVATSMAVEVYRILPNDTDFTPFRVSDRFTGLNSAYIDGVPVYHSPQDRPEYMNQGTLQQHGDNALALAKQLGNADLGPLAVPAAHDASYFPVLGHLVVYPGTWVWPIAVLALLVVVGFGWLARRRAIASFGRLAAGFGLMIVPLAGAAVLAQLFWSLLVALRPAYAAMIDPWQPIWFRYAVCALTAFVVIGWYALWRGRVGAVALQFGAFAWLAILGLVMAYLTPGGSYLAALPALVGAALACAALACAALPGRLSWLGAMLQTVGGAVAVVILVPTVFLFFPALGLATGAAAAIFVALLLFALLPIVELVHPGRPGLPSAVGVTSGSVSDAPAGAPGVSAAGVEAPSYPRYRAMLPTAVALLLAVTFAGVGLVVDRFDAEHPKPTQLMYALDADTGQAFWVTEQDAADGWLKQYVGERKDFGTQFPLLHGSLLTGPAQAASLAAPGLTLAGDVSAGGARTLTLTVHPRADARLVQLSAPDVTVRSATVSADGQSRELAVPSHGFSLLFHGPPPSGVTVTLTIDGTGPATFRVSDGSDGLSELPGFVPRPADVGIKGSHTSELVMVARSVTV